MVVADPTGTTIFFALVGFVVLVLLFVWARAARDDEEAAAREHARRAIADPVGVIGEDLEQITGSLLRWTSWLGVIALVLAALTGVGACAGDAKEAKGMFLSALTWFVLAVAAWYVRSKLSRAASLLLVAVPVADFVAVLIAMAHSRISVGDLFPAVVMPVLLGSAAIKCSVLTFQYHRRVRLGASLILMIIVAVGILGCGSPPTTEQTPKPPADFKPSAQASSLDSAPRPQTEQPAQPAASTDTAAASESLDSPSSLAADLGLPYFQPGQGLTQPKVVKRVQPDFSPLGRHRDLPAGLLVFDAVITAAGRVGEVRVAKPFRPEFDRIVLAAFKQWRFEPARRSGQATSVVMTFTIHSEVR